MENFYLYVLITIMMVIMPGTDTALVTKNTLSQGLRGGQSTVLGIATGLVVHTMAAVLGLSAIIGKSLFLFELVKYAGAIYLFYLGITTLISKHKQFSSEFVQTDGNVEDKISINCNKSCFFQGMFSNILNPKSVIFFMSFLPQFINTSGNVFLQLVLMSFILILFAVLWFLLFVFILNHVRSWFNNPKFQSAFQRITGLMLISLGFKLVFETK
jgi:RhtB (resistance to homoserine/threonine) family protein